MKYLEHSFGDEEELYEILLTVTITTRVCFISPGKVYLGSIPPSTTTQCTAVIWFNFDN